MSYKKVYRSGLSDIIVRMGGSYSINVQSMVEILRNTLPERTDVDHHMVYNVRLRTHRRKLELEAVNIEVLANHFNASFINDYKSGSDNYFKGKFVLLYYSCCLIV